CLALERILSYLQILWIKLSETYHPRFRLIMAFILRYPYERCLLWISLMYLDNAILSSSYRFNISLVVSHL
ncbi:MAG: hypothetical protein RR404_02255, partial [Bacilli bacterium]